MNNMITCRQEQNQQFVLTVGSETGSNLQVMQPASPQLNRCVFTADPPAGSGPIAAIDPSVHSMYPVEAAPAVRMTDVGPDRDSSKKAMNRKPRLARMLGCWCSGTAADAAETLNGRVYYGDRSNSSTRQSSLRYGYGSAQVSPFAVRPACIQEEASTSSQASGIISPFAIQNGLPSPSSSRCLSPRHGSWHKPTTDTITLHHQTQTQLAITLSMRRTVSANHSEALTEWADARSCLSSDQEGMADVASLNDIGNEAQQLEHISRKTSIPRVLSVKLPWIPDPPLHFADRALQFVPVPAVTGFAAYWSKITERTSPFPQPIDIMMKANWLTRQVHKSIPGFWIRENERRLMVISNPNFTPGGYRAYREVYDKTNETVPTWTPRRDLLLGHCSGEIFYTADGRLILRAQAWTWPSNKLQYVFEDHIHLEDNGQVCFNQMWCLEVETGRTARQQLVGSKQPHPPKSWTSRTK